MEKPPKISFLDPKKFNNIPDNHSSNNKYSKYESGPAQPNPTGGQHPVGESGPAQSGPRSQYFLDRYWESKLGGDDL